MDNTTDTTLKDILKYRNKGRGIFNFNEVYVSEIKNQIFKLNKRNATQSYDNPV